MSPPLLSVTLSPTAQTALLDAPLTALSVSNVAPAGFGVATTDQLVPLKFSASVVGPEPWKPTAQMSVGETAETALRFAPDTVGLVTTWNGPEGGVADETTVTVTAGEVLAS